MNALAGHVHRRYGDKRGYIAEVCALAVETTRVEVPDDAAGPKLVVQEPSVPDATTYEVLGLVGKQTASEFAEILDIWRAPTYPELRCPKLGKQAFASPWTRGEAKELGCCRRLASSLPFK